MINWEERVVPSRIDILIDQSLRPHCLQCIFSFQTPLGRNLHVSAYKRSAAPLQICVQIIPLSRDFQDAHASVVPLSFVISTYLAHVRKYL